MFSLFGLLIAFLGVVVLLGYAALVTFRDIRDGVDAKEADGLRKVGVWMSVGGLIFALAGVLVDSLLILLGII